MPIIQGNEKLPGTRERMPADFNGDALGPFTNAGAPVDGTAGTGTLAGIAGKGALLVDTDAGDLYVNTGDSTTVAWKKFTHA